MSNQVKQQNCVGDCDRQSGRAFFEDKIHQIRKCASNLQTISDSMPKELSDIQNEALYNLAKSILINF
jgi:hypothetical protein